MFELLKIGEQLLAALDKAGDWLLYQPFSIAQSVGFQQSSEYHWITNAILGFLEKNPILVEMNVASLLMGSLLTLVLGYRIIKFFVNLL